MTFRSPIPFRASLRALAVRQLMPTNLSSAELSRLETSVMETSMFSARTLLVGVLDKYKRVVEDILNPRTELREDGTPFTAGINPATARLEIKNVLRETGYTPDPDKRGTIQDLSSDRRIDLVIKTNVEKAQGYGSWRQGQAPAVLDAWPAEELFRAEDRREERNWQSRWRLAGDATGRTIGDGWTITAEGRMIALKNHPIWEQLGSSELFEDGLNAPYPPFAFSSGMWTRDIDRDEAIAIGLIDSTTTIEPQTRPFETQEAA